MPDRRHARRPCSGGNAGATQNRLRNARLEPGQRLNAPGHAVLPGVRNELDLECPKLRRFGRFASPLRNLERIEIPRDSPGTQEIGTGSAPNLADGRPEPAPTTANP